MKLAYRKIFLLGFAICLLPHFSLCQNGISERVNRNQFLAAHDLKFNTMPTAWEEAPYFANGFIGSMIYGDSINKNQIKIQVFRTDLQQSILFYASNHDYFYINDFFIPLMKSNPLKVSLVFSEDLGGGVVSQDYKYTYNQHKYPVTIEEKATDPTPWQFGDYVKTSKLVYIKNN